MTLEEKNLEVLNAAFDKIFGQINAAPQAQSGSAHVTEKEPVVAAPFDPEATMPEIPCRVSADLRKYMREQEESAFKVEPFDPFDDDQMADILPKNISGPVQDLLLKLAQIRLVEKSYGEVDKAKAYDLIRPLLGKLESGCEAEWNDER